MSMDNTRMTPARLADIEGREKAATPGPWEILDYATYEDHDECCLELQDDTIESSKHENAEFIATARTDIPDLLAEVRRLTAELSAVTLERDAAVKDLYYLAEDHGHCDICAHDDDGFTPIPPHCTYVQENCFKWRGVCAENAPEGSGGNG